MLKTVQLIMRAVEAASVQADRLVRMGSALLHLRAVIAAGIVFVDTMVHHILMTATVCVFME